MKHDLETFVCSLEKELHDRYQLCEDHAATPSSILLAVLNAVAAARVESVLKATTSKDAAPHIETEAEKKAREFIIEINKGSISILESEEPDYTHEAESIIRALLLERGIK